MAIKSKTNLTIGNNNAITDALGKQNTAARVRNDIQDVIDSSLNVIDILSGSVSISNLYVDTLNGVAPDTSVSLSDVLDNGNDLNGRTIGGTMSNFSLTNLTCDNNIIELSNVVTNGTYSMFVGKYNEASGTGSSFGMSLLDTSGLNTSIRMTNDDSYDISFIQLNALTNSFASSGSYLDVTTFGINLFSRGQITLSSYDALSISANAGYDITLNSNDLRIFCSGEIYSDTKLMRIGVSNNIVSSQYSLIFGNVNGIYNSEHSLIHGYLNTLTASSVYSHILGGGCSAYASQHSHILGDAHSLSASNYNSISGGGHSLTSSSSNQVSGEDNSLNASDGNIVSGGTNTLDNSTVNAVFGGYNKTKYSSNSLVSGIYNSLTQSSYSLVSGFNNSLTNSSYSAVAGFSHDITNSNFSNISGDNHSLTSSAYNIVSGQSNVLTTSDYSNISGKFGESIDGSYNTLFGLNSYIENSAFSLVGGNGVSGMNGDGIFAVGSILTSDGFNYTFLSGQNVYVNSEGELARNALSGTRRQFGTIQTGATTTNATPTRTLPDSGHFYITSNSTYQINVRVVGTIATTGDSVSYEASGIIKNVGGTTTLVAAITPTQIASDVSLLATAVTITADNSNDAIDVTVTGVAATSIYWHCVIDYVKVTFV
jgi:hypothetical protein